MPWRGRTASRRWKVPRRLLWSIAGILLLAAALWFVPTPYYVTAPGAAIDTSRVVQVEGGHPRRGDLYMLIVTSRPANLFWYLYSKFDSRVRLETRTEFLGEIPDYQQYLVLTRRMMENSQQTAKALGLKWAGRGSGVEQIGAEITGLLSGSPVHGVLQPGDIITAVEGEPVRTAEELADRVRRLTPGSPVVLSLLREGQELRLKVPTGAQSDPQRQGEAALGVYITDAFRFDLPVPVEIRTGSITGPSAGLMFTLQIIDQLLPTGITGGLRVAGTGTVEPDGRVGAIGGVQQKVFTAEAAGAEVMLVPRENYQEALAVATRVQVVPVSTVEEALSVLMEMSRSAQA